MEEEEQKQLIKLEIIPHLVRKRTQGMENGNRVYTLATTGLPSHQ